MTDDLRGLPEVTVQTGGDPSLLFDELLYIIKLAIKEHPRSQQKAIGPSGAGEPCTRRLAHQILDTPPARELPPGWRPTVGTAVHEWLDEIFKKRNAYEIREIGTGPRWLTSTRVDVGAVGTDRMRGTIDLADRTTQTAVDWKVVGPSSLKRMRADFNAGRGLSPTYRTQLHLYAAGLIAAGQPIAQVMLVALPSAGELADAQFWAEPFNQGVVDDAMARMRRVHTLLASLKNGAITVTNGELRAIGRGDLADPDGQDGDLAIPVNADSCRYCPWLQPDTTNLASACPGDTEAIAAQQERALAKARSAVPFA